LEDGPENAQGRLDALACSCMLYLSSDSCSGVSNLRLFNCRAKERFHNIPFVYILSRQVISARYAQKATGSRAPIADVRARKFAPARQTCA
jgi:hypothetical protein